MKLLINKIQQVFSYIINPKKHRIITNELYANYVILFISTFGIIGIIINLLSGPDERIYISFAVFVSTIIFFFLNRYTEKFTLLTSLGFCLLMIAYNFYYIFYYGSKGPMVYFGFLIVYLTLFYSNAILKYILFSTFLINIIVLYYLEFSVPGFIKTYDNLDKLSFDHLSIILIVILTFFLLIRTLIKIQLNEKEIAQESNHLKSTFLANTSHDLRAPANSILSFSELLSNENLSHAEINKYVKIIHSNSTQLLNLINDIFDISIIDSKNLIISPQNTNINEVLEEVYTNFKREIEVSNKNIDLDVIFGLPITQSIVYIDPIRIKQILTNLLQNAIKHTDMGAIAFGYDKKMDENELLFFVKDTGSGIPKDKIEEIFERYVTSIGKPEKPIGIGLGLHITSSLVKLMKGNIWVESKVDVGSKFYFTIPLKDQYHLDKGKA